MNQTEEDKLDAEYLVHEADPKRPLEVYIAKTSSDTEQKPELFHRIISGIDIRASELSLNEGVETGGGWRIERETFREREDSENDRVKWYYEGEPIEYQDGTPILPRNDHSICFAHTEPVTKKTGTLRGKGELLNGRTLGVLGIGDFKNTSGTVTIDRGSVGRPARFDVDNSDGTFSLYLTLGPIDFDQTVRMINRTGQLYIEIGDFGDNPLLVQRSGTSAFDWDIYWVPYTGPFKAIYSHLETVRGDGQYWHPYAKVYSGSQSLEVARNLESEPPAVIVSDVPQLTKLNDQAEFISGEITQIKRSVSLASKTIVGVIWLLLVVVAGLFFGVL